MYKWQLFFFSPTSHGTWNEWTLTVTVTGPMSSVCRLHVFICCCIVVGMVHSPGQLGSPAQAHALIHPDKIKTDRGVFVSVACSQQRNSSGSLDGSDSACMSLDSRLYNLTFNISWNHYYN